MPKNTDYLYFTTSVNRRANECKIKLKLSAQNGPLTALSNSQRPRASLYELLTPWPLLRKHIESIYNTFYFQKSIFIFFYIWPSSLFTRHIIFLTLHLYISDKEIFLI